MVCIGNHEDNFNFTHYINRFTMPGTAQNMWYSWDIGPIHFVAYSSEVYHTNSAVYTPAAQYAWLKQDLENANLPQNRKLRPWIIAYGHRPMYCSNADDDYCTQPLTSPVRVGLETLFYEQGVDFIIEAHEHSYERLYPVYNLTTTQFNYVNPQAPVHVISGAAGCNENDGYCINPIFWKGGDWSAFTSWGVLTYGYARLEVVNATHLFWEELVVRYIDSPILDSIWVVQQNHGKRKNNTIY